MSDSITQITERKIKRDIFSKIFPKTILMKRKIRTLEAELKNANELLIDTTMFECLGVANLSAYTHGNKQLMIEIREFKTKVLKHLNK